MDARAFFGGALATTRMAIRGDRTLSVRSPSRFHGPPGRAQCLSHRSIAGRHLQIIDEGRSRPLSRSLSIHDICLGAEAWLSTYQSKESSPYSSRWGYPP